MEISYRWLLYVGLKNLRLVVHLPMSPLQQLPQIRGYQSKVIRTSKQAQMIQVLNQEHHIVVKYATLTRQSPQFESGCSYKCVSSQAVDGSRLQIYRAYAPQGFESFLACNFPGQLSWLKRVIHNHKSMSSILIPGTFGSMAELVESGSDLL